MIIYFLTFSLSGVILEGDSSANLNITILQFSRIYYKPADQFSWKQWILWTVLFFSQILEISLKLLKNVTQFAVLVICASSRILQNEQRGLQNI